MTPPDRFPPADSDGASASPERVDLWLDEHGSAVLGLLRKLVSRARAEDLLAESFHRVRRQLETRRRAGKAELTHDQVRSRLLLTARELASAHTERPAAVPATTQESATFPLLDGAPLLSTGTAQDGRRPEPASPSGGNGYGATAPPAAGDARREQVRQAFASLDEQQRQLLHGVVLGGDSLSEAAASSGLPVPEARGRLLAALRSFRAAVDRLGAG